MAMPASGSLGLKCNINAVPCSGIGVGVCGTPPVTSCLTALSVAAGKTAPHSMVEFYNFNRETSFKAIGFCNISRVGTVGVSNTICTVDCLCSNTAMVAGQQYTVTLCHQICANSQTGSRGTVQVCGSAAGYCCTVLNGVPGCNFSCTFIVGAGDSVCIINNAVHTIAGGAPVSCARTCITTVAPTLGLFCKTTGCSDCLVYTC